MNNYAFALCNAGVGILVFAWFKLMKKYGGNNQ
jgi:hypothetical protein